VDEAAENLAAYCTLKPEACTDELRSFWERTRRENCCQWREAHDACLIHCDDRAVCQENEPDESCDDANCNTLRS